MSESNTPPVTDSSETTVSDEIQEEVLPTGPIIVGTFADLGLSAPVIEALTDMGFSGPMEVQAQCAPIIMKGRDLMVQSRTGSGKTAAFGIPMINSVVKPEDRFVQAIILLPTRELALQVAAELTRISAKLDVTVVPVYGGAPMGKQIEQLKAGAQIVCGTPGRILDHLRRGTLKLDQVRCAALDECDEMLSMGFQEDIENILEHTPKTRQTLLFSATMPAGIQRLARRFLRDPEQLKLSADFVGVQSIKHAYYSVTTSREAALLKVLEFENPVRAIVFCNTRRETSRVAAFLRKNGQSAEAISSDLSQSDRERVMTQMREGSIQFMVATDVAARGIDLDQISHVINFSFPDSAEVYIHRTGRTGRAGRHGIAVSLIGPTEVGAFYNLKLLYKIKPEERSLPSAIEVQSRREGEYLELLREKFQKEPGQSWRGLARRLVGVTDGEKVIAALLADALGEVTTTGPHGIRPAVVEEAPERPTRSARPGGDRERGSGRERDSRDRGGRDDRPRAPREHGRDRDDNRSSHARGAREDAPARNRDDAARDGADAPVRDRDDAPVRDRDDARSRYARGGRDDAPARGRDDTRSREARGARDDAPARDRDAAPARDRAERSDAAPARDRAERSDAAPARDDAGRSEAAGPREAKPREGTRDQRPPRSEGRNRTARTEESPRLVEPHAERDSGARNESRSTPEPRTETLRPSRETRDDADRGEREAPPREADSERRPRQASERRPRRERDGNGGRGYVDGYREKEERESRPNRPRDEGTRSESSAARGESSAARSESPAARGESSAARGESSAARGESSAARGESGRSPRLEGARDRDGTTQRSRPPGRTDGGDRSTRSPERSGRDEDFMDVWADSPDNSAVEARGDRGRNGHGERNVRPARSDRDETSERSERSERSESEVSNGRTRLYLNLGHKDDTSPDEIASLAADLGITLPLHDIDVMKTHAYLDVGPEEAPRLIDGLSGRERSGRQLVCERAKPRR